MRERNPRHNEEDVERLEEKRRAAQREAQQTGWQPDIDLAQQLTEQVTAVEDLQELPPLDNGKTVIFDGKRKIVFY